MMETSTGDGFEPWPMAVRAHLNPSGTERIYRIGLLPPASATWRAGDIAEFELPDGQRRSYSIASVPAEGRLDLLVRDVRAANGKPGRGTAWLLHETQPGDRIRLRVRPNDAFRAPAGDGPLLLVGAGSGLAALRPHILEALASDRPAWLVYGERHCDVDSQLCRELQAWHVGGQLYRLNLALSHPQPGQGRYVQDIIAQYAGDIRHFMGEAGSAMICGSPVMGAAVETALTDTLGEGWMGAAAREVRYRQALY